MKEKLTKNLGVKLLSLPLAAIIWMIIINIDDPVITRTYPNIAIELQNTEAIASLGKVYEIAEGNAISVVVTGKRSILDKLRSTDLKVTADLKQISAFNLIEVEVTCEKYSYAGLSFSTKPKMLTVTLEDKATKQFKVNVESQGSIDDNYYVGSMEAKPAMVEVSGAESVIEKIADIRVMVHLDDETESFKKTDLTPKAYDADGKEIDSSKLEFSEPSITVKVNVQETKSVSIGVTTTGTPAAGYNVLQIDYDPSQVRIAGEKEALKQIISIPVFIDIENARATVEKEIVLTDYLPDGITIVGNTNSMAVKITIEEMASKEFSLQASDIAARNLPDNMEFAYGDSDGIYKVTVMGTEEDLQKLTLEQLGAYVDLTGLEAGSHLLDVKFGLGSEYVVSNNPTILIELQNKEDGDNNQEDGALPGDGEDAPDSGPEDEPGQAPPDEEQGLDT